MFFFSDGAEGWWKVSTIPGDGLLFFSCWNPGWRFAGRHTTGRSKPYQKLSVFFVRRSSDDQHTVILSKIHMFFFEREREREAPWEHVKSCNKFCPLVHSQNAGAGLRFRSEHRDEWREWSDAAHTSLCNGKNASHRGKGGGSTSGGTLLSETSGGIGTTQACEGSERDFYWAKGGKTGGKEGTKSNTKGEGTKSITSSRRIWDLHQTCCGAWWSCIKGLEQLDFWYNERCLGKEAQTGGDFEKGTLRI